MNEKKEVTYFNLPSGKRLSKDRIQLAFKNVIRTEDGEILFDMMHYECLRTIADSDKSDADACRFQGAQTALYYRLLRIANGFGW